MDLYGLRRLALERLPLKPWEFWALTPIELNDMLAGAAWRDEKEWERAAWVTAQLINISGKVVKKPVKPSDLLGRKKQRTKNLDADVKILMRRQLELDERKARGTNDR